MEEKLKELTKGLKPDDPQLQEAEKLWAHLDKLARTDPKGYNDFLAKQREEYRKEQLAREETQKAKKSMLPKPMYVVKTTRTDIDFAPIVYVNITQHTECPPPQLEDGTPARDNEIPGNLIIPLSVGPLWDWKDSTNNEKPCKVCDIVFHPKTVERGEKEMQFRMFIIELALQNMEDDHKFRLHRAYKTVSGHKYLGPNKSPAAQYTLAELEEQKKAEKIKQMKKGKKKKNEEEEEEKTTLKTKIEATKSIANIVLPFDKPKDDNSSTMDIRIPGISKDNDNKKSNLIEEISSTKDRTPSYTMKVVQSQTVDDDDLLKIGIQLPLDVTMKGLNVDISDLSCKLDGEHCTLSIVFPKEVDSTKALAKYVKKKSLLKISVPCR